MGAKVGEEERAKVGDAWEMEGVRWGPVKGITCVEV